MASFARPRHHQIEDEDASLSHYKSPLKLSVSYLPEIPPTRLDLRGSLVRTKGGGFDAPSKEWFNNVDGNGLFQSRAYDEWVTFVIGFQSTWLELEKIEDFITRKLFIKTGRDLPTGLPERLFYLDFAKTDSCMRAHSIVDEIKKMFPFTTADTIPGYFREYQIKALISNTASCLKKLHGRFGVKKSIFVNHSNFRRPPGSCPKPDKNSKYDLSDCHFMVVPILSLSIDRLEISLIDILDKLRGHDLYVLNKNIKFVRFMEILKDKMKFDSLNQDVCWSINLQTDSIVRPIRSKNDLIAAIVGLHAPASKTMSLSLVNIFLSSISLY